MMQMTHMTQMSQMSQMSQMNQTVPRTSLGVVPMPPYVRVDASDKLEFDLLQAEMAVRRGRPVTQQEAFAAAVRALKGDMKAHSKRFWEAGRATGWERPRRGR